jgi:hypothetical protein
MPLVLQKATRRIRSTSDKYENQTIQNSLAQQKENMLKKIFPLFVALVCTTNAVVAFASAPDAGLPATSDWKVDDKIQARFSDGAWYNGRISAVNDDKTYNIKYDDGDVSKRLRADRVRARTAPKPTKASIGNAQAAPKDCGFGPSGYLMKRCNGICVDTARDPNNCGFCGIVCSSGRCNTGCEM